MTESSLERVSTGGAVRRWRPGGTVRLVCLPPAGGSSIVFRGLARGLPDRWSVLAIDLPGHGGDPAPPMTDVVAMAEAVTAMLGGVAAPFLVLGHSLGAMVAWELAAQRRLPVSGVILCGLASPDRLHEVRPIADVAVADEVLLKQLSLLGGVPEVMFKSMDFARYYLPPLRADLRAYERHAREWPESVGRRSLHVPVLALAGTEDPLAAPSMVEPWRAIQPGLRVGVIPGGHFFPQERAAEVAEAVVAFSAGLTMSRAVTEDHL